MKTIKDVLNIDVQESNGRFQADAKILSGSPPVGIGDSEYEALYDLLAKLMFQIGSDHQIGHKEQWTTAIKNFWRNKEYNG